MIGSRELREKGRGEHKGAEMEPPAAAVPGAEDGVGPRDRQIGVVMRLNCGMSPFFLPTFHCY